MKISKNLKREITKQMTIAALEAENKVLKGQLDIQLKQLENAYTIIAKLLQVKK